MPISMYSGPGTPTHVMCLTLLGQILVKNPFPCFADFQQKGHLRYLYQVYDSVRGPTLFVPKDRLFLVRSILLRYFDLEILAGYGAVERFMALHDANRGERVTRDTLTKVFPTSDSQMIIRRPL